MAYRSRDVGRPNWGSVKFMAPALETGFWTFVFRRLEEEETELENQKTKVLTGLGGAVDALPHP